MRKLILLFTLLFSLSTMGQEYIPGQLQIGGTPVANSGDFISALGTHNGNANIVSKTQITVQQLTDAINGGGAQNLQMVLAEGNTSTIGIDFTGFGNKLNFSYTGNGNAGINWDTDNQDWTIKAVNMGSGFGASTHLDFQAQNGIITAIPLRIGQTVIVANATLQANNGFDINSTTPSINITDVDNSSFPTLLGISQNTATRNITLPNKSGDIVVLSDQDAIISSGTVSDENINITIGSPTAKINIDGDEEKVIVTGGFEAENIQSSSLIIGKEIPVLTLVGGASLNRNSRIRQNASQADGTAYDYNLPANKGGTFAMLDDVTGGPTNLGYNTAVNDGTVTSSSGTNATIPSATTTTAGLMKASFYEEGTFTVTLVDSGGGATYTATTSTASYTRVGNQVNFVLRISDVNSTGSPSIQRFQINTSGLPIITSNGGFNVSEFRGSNRTFYSIAAYRSSTQNISFYTQTSLDGDFGANPMMSGTFSNGEIQINGSYITNEYTH